MLQVIGIWVHFMHFEHVLSNFVSMFHVKQRHSREAAGVDLVCAQCACPNCTSAQHFGFLCGFLERNGAKDSVPAEEHFAPISACQRAAESVEMLL